MRKNRRWNVVARSRGIVERGVTTGKGHRSFMGKAQMVISDPAEAREIEQKYGKQVGVIEDDRLAWHYDNDRQTDGHNSSIHHYTFSGVDMSHIRTTKKSEWVWVRMDGSQKRMLRSEAIESGYEIVE